MTDNEPHLARHLASRHADGLAMTRSLAENLKVHTHEHNGPGTIRNHDRDDLSWDQAKLDRVLIGLMVDDPTFNLPDQILADPASHPTHRMYAMINIGIRDRGERWAKCPNCGDPYQLTEEWSNSSICSERCSEEYVHYLSNPNMT